MTKESGLQGAILAGLVVLTVGCASFDSRSASRGPGLYVSVDALSDVKAYGKRTYFLHPGLKDVRPDDLQFREFASYVHGALQSKGFVPAQDAPAAEVVVFLSYGVGEPQMTYYSYPIFGLAPGQTGTFSASTYGSGGYAHTTGTVTTARAVGVVGTGIGTRTEYTTWANLEGVDVEAFLKTQEVVQLWRTTMGSSGYTADLRRSFPVMVAAAEPHIASNTGQQVGRMVYESSPEVLALRRGAMRAAPAPLSRPHAVGDGGDRGATHSKSTPSEPAEILLARDPSTLVATLTELAEFTDHRLSLLTEPQLAALRQVFEIASSETSVFRWARPMAPKDHPLYGTTALTLKAAGADRQWTEIVWVDERGQVVKREIR